ncbi:MULTISPECIES: hypothetical protein [unclassified Pseudomonas]|uniref:hypothetical protein n=1 Tax=unclassified Pseudomonas TaxID=196821 RepID=UPI001113EB43|nr:MULTISPECIES: hypothetical protein [unclassified Pseudomonas]
MNYQNQLKSRPCIPFTNDCLLMLAADGSFSFNQHMGVTLQAENRAENANPKLMKAAERLAAVFGTEHIVTIYRMLGSFLNCR